MAAGSEQYRLRTKWRKLITTLPTRKSSPALWAKVCWTLPDLQQGPTNRGDTYKLLGEMDSATIRRLLKTVGAGDYPRFVGDFEWEVDTYHSSDPGTDWITVFTVESRLRSGPYLRANVGLKHFDQRSKTD